MFLKSLELNGFKSFAEKTALLFNGGITCIVGPNGCGKSNVADAIRWVLGEQSAKSLRGQRMEDVIFSGAEVRKPLGRSEVTLVINNEEGRFTGLPGFRELSELRVTRRLFRSGESEYLLNNITCRLKDIVDLLAGHAVTPQMLSLMEQGHIDAIINAKPLDRRFLLEEVAGIAKFKHRKTIALRKLEATEANLLRVLDILEEVRRQRNSLNRQAKKAERYRHLQEELRRLDLGVLAQEYDRLRDELRAVERAYYDSKGREAHLARRLAEGERRAEELRQTADELEHQLREQREHLARVERAADTCEHQRSTLQEQLAEERSRADGLRADSARLGDEAAELEAEVRRRQAGVAAARAALEESDERLREQQAASRHLSDQRRAASQHLEECQRHLLRLLGEIAELRNQRTALETQRTLLLRRGEKLTREQDAAAARLASLALALDQQRSQAAALREQQTEQHRRRQEAAARLAECDARLDALRGRRQRLTAMLLEARAQRATLEDLFASRQDYNAGVQALLGTSSNGSAATPARGGASAGNGGGEAGQSGDGAASGEAQRLEGLLGVVADFLEVPVEFERAVEAVLGEHLQTILAEDTAAAVRAIAYLKEQAAGRSAFIPKELLREPLAAPNGHPLARDGCVGPALSFVRCSDEVRPLVRFLLGHVMIVEDLESGLRFWRSQGPLNGRGVTYVTRDAEIVHANGIVSGGRSGSESAGILARRRQLQELRRSIAAEDGRLRTLEEQLQAAEAERQATQAQTQEMEAALRRLEEEIGGRQRDLERLEAEVKRDEEHLAVVAFEARQAGEERSTLDQQLQALDEELAAAAARHRDRQADIAGGEARLRDLDAQLEAHAAAAHAAQTSVAERRAALSSLELEWTRRRDRLAYVQEQAAAQQQQLRDAEARLASHAHHLEEATLALHEHLAEAATRRAQVTARDDDLAMKRAALEQHERERRGAQADLDAAREEASGHAVRRSELGAQAQHRAQRCLDEYRRGIEEALAEARLGQEELAGATARLPELRDALQAMGEVNLAALQEFEELEARYTFLQAQHNDLEKSVQALHRALRKITQSTRERFLAAFEQVRAQFRGVYAKLSNGGESDLQLTNLEDIWETGLEIMAQPAGKRLQNISLLSAGEKAMAAIALLLAVFLVRPAPFCIMDEVDAPLDESNVTRFLDLLAELTEQTQFLIVTHNRRTMSYADALYGVTMEEQGVSKVVSVSFVREETAGAAA
ncbi:MAG: chromosome segregation protein SMC [Candidatus Tectomicrobia bacterium]|nr:chromosome segregation protein SMC [Candidatus Tectomicrobia bacterium]